LNFSVISTALAQERNKFRPNYINFNYAFQNAKFNSIDKVSSNIGAALTVGHTYYILKSKPLGGVVRFGIDATWIDINYANYNLKLSSIPSPQAEFYNISDLVEQKIHQLEIGMQVGPSITITPIENLNLSAYFRFAPSFSTSVRVIDEDTYVDRGYASFFVAGASVAYKMISLGVEQRWGKPKYKSINLSDVTPELTSFKTKVQTEAIRLYLSLRF